MGTTRAPFSDSTPFRLNSAHGSGTDRRRGEYLTGPTHAYANRRDVNRDSGPLRAATRGQRLPMSQSIDTSGIWYRRFSGQGQAAWLVRELPVPLIVAVGRRQTVPTRRSVCVSPDGLISCATGSARSPIRFRTIDDSGAVRRRGSWQSGVMQDIDRTRSAAIGDVMNLHWRSENAALP